MLNAHCTQLGRGYRYLGCFFETTPGYGSWRFFHQQNWYQSDTCLGAPPTSSRLSLEYIAEASIKYACGGACTGNCPTRIESGVAEVFIR
ncbi:hypothetical protein ACFL6C_01765 [Myxococcota bacterium]